MCGIFCYLNGNNFTEIFNNFLKLKPRGPDNSQFIIDDQVILGFHRLAINDLTDAGNQPMDIEQVSLLCNGEIYNCNEIKEKYKFKCHSNSDCEVILRLFLHLKTIYNHTMDVVHELCNILDGEFSFIIYDKPYQEIIIARDHLGVRPLFIGKNNQNKEIGFSSELKALDKLFDSVEQFIPGTFQIILLDHLKENKQFYFNLINQPLKEIHPNYVLKEQVEEISPTILQNIKKLLINSVKKRMLSDRPICALLSGGLDSSLICGILSKYCITGHHKLNTFSIGMTGSTDLVYAKKVADFIGSNHHEIVISKEDMLNSIEEVIIATETFDITTIRASIPNYLLAKYIKNNTNFKVILTGEISDEVLGGYLYFKNAPDAIELYNESNRLLENLCYFDNLRADRCISSNGLEARVPFSDKFFINYILSLDPQLRMSNDKIEKYILRKAFDNDYIIPEDILWRKKEAFSDGVSANSNENSWYKILQNHIDTLITDEEYNNKKNDYKYLTPFSKEAYYYRKLYHNNYKNDKVIPYFWMPKWAENVNDPSAREL